MKQEVIELLSRNPSFERKLFVLSVKKVQFKKREVFDPRT